MKILVFSDTHGSINSTLEIINATNDVDLIIHLGDLVNDVEDIQSVLDDIKIEYVAGNNDYYSRDPVEKSIEVEGKKIFLTHGHTYKVKSNYETIITKGIILGADIVLFGHTHEVYEKIHGGILYLNPGSISLPLKGKPSYGLIEIIDNKIENRIIYL